MLSQSLLVVGDPVTQTHDRACAKTSSAPTAQHGAPQKLLMLYYEVVRKYDAAGKLLPEMILVWCVLTRRWLTRSAGAVGGMAARNSWKALSMRCQALAAA